MKIRITNAPLPRVYVDTAPHFVANSGLTLASWKEWSAALTMRAMNHCRLDGLDSSIVASGQTVFDFSASRQIHRGIDLNFSAENFTDRAYYETQNYFVSRVLGELPDGAHSRHARLPADAHGRGDVPVIRKVKPVNKA